MFFFVQDSKTYEFPHAPPKCNSKKTEKLMLEKGEDDPNSGAIGIRVKRTTFSVCVGFQKLPGIPQLLRPLPGTPRRVFHFFNQQLDCWVFRGFPVDVVKFSRCNRNGCCFFFQVQGFLSNLFFFTREKTNLRTFQQSPKPHTPKTPNRQFMKEFLSFWGLGMSGVCCKGMLGFP